MTCPNYHTKLFLHSPSTSASPVWNVIDIPGICNLFAVEPTLRMFVLLSGSPMYTGVHLFLVNRTQQHSMLPKT